MMSPEFLKLSPLSADRTMIVGMDGPGALQQLLTAMGWSLLLSFSRDGGGEVQRWTSAKGRRAVDLHCLLHDVAALPIPTHTGVGLSPVAQDFAEIVDQLKVDADNDPEVFAFFFKHPSLLDVIAFYELDPEDRMAIAN